MKKILITGKDSYIGSSFENWIKQWPNDFKIDTLDVKDEEWKDFDFSKYDAVLHVAAIVHIKNSNDNLYYKVNRDLALDIALKAKKEKIKHFIFLSTMAVYGKENGAIDDNELCKPNTIYAKSKFEAESMINELQDDDFITTVLRPPIVYGKNCKGNYARLSKLFSKISIYPKISNKRSMLYVDHLSEYIRLLINDRIGGIHHPQNIKYIDVKDIFIETKKIQNKKYKIVSILNIVNLFKTSSIYKKVFGDLFYSMNLYDSSQTKLLNASNVFDFETTIRKTECQGNEE